MGSGGGRGIGPAIVELCRELEEKKKLIDIEKAHEAALKARQEKDNG